MLLVHEKIDNPGRWEVAWMWLPHFLAADRRLHRHVDQEMKKEFKGRMVQDGVVDQMNRRVIELILEQYPIPGLRQLLETYVYLNPDEKGSEEEPPP